MKTIIAFITCALLALPAFAHNEEGKMADRMVKRISSHLELDQDQQLQLEQIFAERKPQMQAIMEQMKNLKQETNTAIRAILTDEQKEKFEQHLAKREQKRKQFMKNHL